MATNKVLNVKYGKKENLPSSKQDGALYVATKENNKAELYVDLDSTRYLISESATVDPELSSTSENALQNKVIYSELTDLQTQIEGRATSAYATCPTAAATAAKVITTQGGTDWVLKAGSIITVLFTYTNEASNPTFNVNGTGAKNVYYGASRITTSSLSYAGYKNRPMNFMYDGTQYRFIGWGVDSNSDTKVKQLSAITTAGEYPVILGYNTATSEVTNSVNKTSTLKYNPSTQILTAPTFKGTLDGTAIMANHATEAEKLVSWDKDEEEYIDTSVGSSTNPVYFNGGVPIQCGDTLNVNINGSASTLSQVLPIEKGGTNADTLEEAQTNLGITTLNNEVSDLKDNVNSLEAELATSVSNLNTSITSGDTNTLNEAKAYADTAEADAIKTANEYTDSKLGDFTGGDFTELQTQVNTNTSDIATLKGDVATHTANIQALAGDITTNSTNINTNVSNIAANTTAINTTNSALTTHKNEKATGSVLGHVTLSDTASNSNDATKGIAATPKAVYAVANDLTTHIAAAEELYIYVGDEELGTTPTKDADTLNGKTAAQIIAEASGQTAEAGTVGFSTSTITSGTAVTLTNVSTGDALLPRTSIANVTGLQAKLDTIPAQPMVYVTGTTAPTGAIGTIWFEGPVSGKYTIRIWNGSAWEVMNSWQ